MTSPGAHPSRVRRGPGQLRAHLGRGDSLLATFVKSPDPDVAEIVVRAGYGCLIADLEHSVLGLRDVASIVRVAELEDVPVIVRVGPGSLHLAGRALDAGAAGVQVADVSSAAIAAAARAAVLYPPRGARGVAFSHRAASFGMRSPIAYLNEAEGSVALIAQVESSEGVAALPELLGDDAFDAFFLGPTDLAASLGHPGDLDHRSVRDALDRAARLILGADRALGIFVRDPEEGSAWRRRGATLIACGSDLGLLAGAAQDEVRRFGAAAPTGTVASR